MGDSEKKQGSSEVGEEGAAAEVQREIERWWSRSKAKKEAKQGKQRKHQ